MAFPDQLGTIAKTLFTPEEHKIMMKELSESDDKSTELFALMAMEKFCMTSKKTPSLLKN